VSQAVSVIHLEKFTYAKFYRRCTKILQTKPKTKDSYVYRNYPSTVKRKAPQILWVDLLCAGKDLELL
jgi:hypothetical protein